ncbi:MAG: group II intron reverse transcriptase/maturase [Gammaproteobacteria bacterium]|nr:group II intron reverse transcriptase/maturase [Gammaproteobacteria bacterium]
MESTEFQHTTTTKLTRIAQLSRRDRGKHFHCLMHHYNVDSLRECFQEQDGKRALGNDGISKEDYGEFLEENLTAVVQRMKTMSYRPGPVRQVLIPKEGSVGATRPLGISNFEDKLIQKMTRKILENIYEPLFLDCSFGFRPNRSCHDAIRSLGRHLLHNEVQTIIDIDLANFFGTIDHQMLVDMLGKKIKDQRFIRYINRMFKAGVLSDQELVVSDEGVPQGSICSPVLANVYAHYVLDTWFQSVVKKHCRGRVELFRYADDAVICCRHNKDAERIKVALIKRLAKFKLKLNESKTKLVAFSKAMRRKGIKQGVFDFLGFTFYLGRSRKGNVIPKVKTSGKRLSSKLKKVNQWARRVRNMARLPVIWETFCAKLAGHIRYFGMTFNARQVDKFLYQATRIIFKWLNRRSQKKSFNWEQFGRFLRLFPLPRVRIHHSLYGPLAT